MTLNQMALAAYTITSATALILIKLHLSQALASLRGTPDWSHLIPAGAGAGLYVTSLILWLFVLTKYELSVAYPIAVGLTLAFSALGGVFILGEAMSVLRLSGMVLILLGVIAIARS